MSELISEALSLPVDERARLLDSLLQTLNPVDQAHTAAWLAVAKQRLDDLDSGCVSAVAGDEVFERSFAGAQVPAFMLTDARVHGKAMLVTDPNSWPQLEEDHLTTAFSRQGNDVP